MKTFRSFIWLTIVLFGLLLASCPKNEEDDRFELLTTPVWQTDTLLANGVDASGPGERLAKFKGEARFKKDGTGNFGIYKGNWWFTENRTQIYITTDSLPFRLTNKIVELTASSFKITTAFPDPTGQTAEIKIRMTFKAK
jgi:hypothetical protein